MGQTAWQYSRAARGARRVVATLDVGLGYWWATLPRTMEQVGASALLGLFSVFAKANFADAARL